MSREADRPDVWPPLPLDAWQETYDTLHMWSQIVGKIRMMQAPPVNHWWQVPLYLTSRGLTTSPIPHGTRTFEIAFDFVAHRLDICTSEGGTETLPLEDRTVAEFYAEIMDRLERLGVPVRIRTRPVELEHVIPFEEDRVHGTYDPAAVGRFWRALVQADRVLKDFRARFIGKSSPVHFFWGSFDLAVARFSGRSAPEHPGGFPNLPDWATREAYSHELWNGGFWPGKGFGEPAFFAYAYPAPAGFAEADPGPEGYFAEGMGEFILPYDAVRRAADPDGLVLGFMQATYDAAAELGRWDRDALERPASEAAGLTRRLALRP